MELYEKLKEVCRCFRIEDTYVGYETIQMGNVNQTYKVNFLLADGRPKSFLVQNVNTYAFRDPVGLMENIDKVTEHIRGKCPGQLCLHFHHTYDRKTYVEDGDNFWRMTNFIPSVTYNSVQDPQIIRNAGRAFGEFQNQLSDFDITALHETIPGFHNTRQRYEMFRQAVAEDKAGRVRQVRREIEYLLSVEDLACTLTDLNLQGKLPLRVTHNDTKINNVLFSPADNSAMVVIDLDTVKPGLVHYDLGDCLRSCCNPAGEETHDISEVVFDLDLCHALLKGYGEQAHGFLTDAERHYLYDSVRLITFELALRFFADYLAGDVYFKIREEGQNLLRARVQTQLCRSIEAREPQLRAMLQKL